MPLPTHFPRTDLRRARNKALRERFDVLYNQQRLRLDDVIERLSREFFLAPFTIGRILKYQP